MAFNLRNRHFLKLLDFSPEEIGFLLGLSLDLKKGKICRIRAAQVDREKYSPDI